MFMNDDHPSFQDRPEDTDSVWRYMDLARYLSLIQNSALHFANAAQMSDPWEGAFSPVNAAIRPQMYGEHYEAMFADADERRRQVLQHTHMNCWHLGEIESAAMWSIYQREGRGVAVRSTWGDLANSIETPRSVYGAKVRYVDYNSTFIPEGNRFDAFLYKRESFEHEREVRLIMMTGFSAPHPTEKGSAINLGPEPPIIPIPVNLERMIGAVYVAPDAPGWVGDVVEAVTRRYDLNVPVKQSDMATDPVA